MIRPTFRKYSLLTALALLACLAAGELAVRLAAMFIPEVDYLASAGFKGRPRVYKSLESFAGAQKHLIPHRNWANHYTNALGFNDLEFQPGKAPGRFRIMALGDSFCYGMVPYPGNVQTLIEQKLNADCASEIEILNFGLPGAHTWEYEVLFRLARPAYNPDLAVIHFYTGNDGPDLVRHLNGLPVRLNPLWSSRLFVFVRNALRLIRGLEADPALKSPAKRTPDRTLKEGGRKVDPGLPDLSDQSPSFVRPRFTPEAFAGQMSDELVRLYGPGAAAARQDWAPVLANLDRIFREARENGIGTALVLYPSVLQVDPELRARTMAEVADRGAVEGFDPGRVDPDAPNRILTEYARQRGLPCLDLTPVFRQAAARSAEPLYLNRDTHWNFRGNALAAAVEAGFLKSLVCGEPPPARAAGD